MYVVAGFAFYSMLRERHILAAMWVVLSFWGPLFASGGAGAEEPDQAQIDFADGLFQRGFFKEAAEEYQGYLDSFSAGAHVSTALYRLGESEYALQQYEAALASFDKVLGRADLDDTMRLRATLSKGEVLYYLKRLADAELTLQALASPEKSPEIRGRALYYLGKTYLDANRADDAMNAFSTVIKELPDDSLAPFARYQAAFVYLQKNDLENAAVAFSEVAGSNVDESLRVECRFRAAETYDKIGWFAAAVKEYEQLRQEYPNSDYARRAAYGYAWALYHAGKYAEAGVAAETFIKENPDAAQSIGMQYLQGNCLQQQQRYDDAAAVYRQVESKYPESEFAARSRYKLAWVLYLSGKPQEAKAVVSEFLQGHGNGAMLGDAAFLLGTIEAADGNYEDAYEEFQLVTEKYPGGEFTAEALYKAGECLAELGRTAEAAKIFENFAKSYPEHPLTEQAILRVGDAKFSADAFAEAIDKYKRILESPADPTVVESTLYRLAITYHNMKDYESSAATFKRLVTEFPNSLYAAEAHVRIGDHLLRDLKDPLGAIVSFEAAFAVDPKGAYAGRALKGQALARYETKDYDAACPLFLRLVGEFPTVTLNEETYVWVGQRCFDQQKWDEAAAALDALLRANPDYPAPERIRFKIAECREAAGKVPESLQLYQAVVNTAPASMLAGQAQYRMGQLYEKQNDPEKALQLYESAANANNGDAAARARFRLGELYEAKNDYAAAAKSYLRVAILFLHEELSPESLWRAGQCYQKSQSPEQAREAFKELVEGYPNSEQAAKAKEQLAQLGQG
jgi:TolA-binding protein